jgi:dihydrofolate reductase
MQIRDDLILIASTDRNGGIGHKNSLLMRIPEDMRHFRAHTLGQTVIVGRKTLASFKDGRPLPDRQTVVLSRQPGLVVPGAVVAANLHELFDVIQGDRHRIHVIGGASVYAQLLPFCRQAILTRFDGEWEADAHLPDISPQTGWVCVDEGAWAMSEKGIRYRMETHERHPAR